MIVKINVKNKLLPPPHFINDDLCLGRNDFMTQLQQKDPILLQWYYNNKVILTEWSPIRSVIMSADQLLLVNFF